ncbi:3322_t:CDS:1, partial [Scutellospora calospora]
DNQFKEIKTNEYIFFTNYKTFKDYLIEERVINASLKIYNETKNKRLNSLLSWIEFHIRSTFYGWNEGYKYHYINNTLDLVEDINKRNIILIEHYLKEVNKYCEEFNIKYLWTWNDLEKYNEEYLAY